MSCSRTESKILGYLDGRLKPSEQQEMDSHLSKCGACSSRVNEFRAVSNLLDELPVITPSPAFDVRVRARVAAEPVKQSWWSWYTPSPRIAFAASMLLMAMMWVGLRPQHNPAEEAQIIQDLPVLENYDVLSNFEPLTDLPQPATAVDDDAQQNQQM